MSTRLVRWAWGDGYRRRLLLVTGAGLVARLAFLGHQPLWRDEAFTELTSRRSWPGMLDVVRHDSAPPLAYVLTHLTTSLSWSASLLRLPAALAGTAAIPLGAALGRRIGGDRCGLCAAGLLALSPAFVLSSRDARMYALAGTLVLAAALALWRAVEAPDRERLGVLGAVTAAALLTHYLTGLGLLAAALSALLALRPERRVAARCGAAMAAGVVPLLLWLPFATPQFEHASAPFWVKVLDGTAMLGALTEFFCGPAVDLHIPHRDLIQVAQGGAITLGGVAGLVTIGWALVRARSRERRAAAYVAGTGFAGLGLLLLLSIWRPLVDARYASVLWPPLAVLIGVGIGRIRPRRLASIPLGAVATATLLLALVPTRSDVVPLVADIGDPPASRSVVLAHREVYLQVLVAAPPDVGALTHIPEASIDWFWGVAVYPPRALMAHVPDEVDTVYEVAETGDATASAIGPDFRAVSRDCAVDACLVVWRRG